MKDKQRILKAARESIKFHTRELPQDWTSQVAQVKNLPANAGDVRDTGWIPGS